MFKGTNLMSLEEIGGGEHLTKAFLQLARVRPCTLYPSRTGPLQAESELLKRLGFLSKDSLMQNLLRKVLPDIW